MKDPSRHKVLFKGSAVFIFGENLARLPVPWKHLGSVACNEAQWSNEFHENGIRIQRSLEKMRGSE